jgi:hypothetical protein
MIDVGIVFWVVASHVWATLQLGPYVFGLTLYVGITFREYGLTRVYFDQHSMFFCPTLYASIVKNVGFCLVWK